MKKLLKILFFASLVIGVCELSDAVSAQTTNYTSPDTIFSLELPPNWARMPQEEIDKYQNTLQTEITDKASIEAGYGIVDGEKFNPYLIIFKRKDLETNINTKSLESLENQLREKLEDLNNQYKDLQEKAGITNPIMEDVTLNKERAVITQSIVAKTQEDKILEYKTFMFFGKKEYVMLGFYNTADKESNRQLNRDSDLNNDINKITNSFTFSSRHEFNPNAVVAIKPSARLLTNVLEKGIMGAIIGGIFAFSSLFLRKSKRTKPVNENEPKQQQSSIISTPKVTTSKNSNFKMNFPKINGHSFLTKLIVTLFLLTIFLFLWVIIMNQLGIRLNKEYFGYNRTQCTNDINWKEIEGCVFWNRADKLENEQEWKRQYDMQYNKEECARRDALCENLDNQYQDKWWGDRMTNFNCLLDNRWNDPECNYERFKDGLIQQNWEYLTSKDKDSHYLKCEEVKCPHKPLFTIE